MSEGGGFIGKRKESPETRCQRRMGVLHASHFFLPFIVVYATRLEGRGSSEIGGRVAVLHL